MEPQPNAWEQDYHAMMLGLREYMRKSGFSKVVLGLSGGIDSALVATIAADAVGPENVHCVMLPSEYTSQTSLDDAADCAARLGTRLDTVRIDGARDAVSDALTCRWRNANHRDWMMGPAGEVIPPRIITKPPSAELRPDQVDQDSLPPYEILDAILEGLVEKDLSLADLVDQGFDADTVRNVERLLYGSEWKRYQAAPGPRISTRAFWLDRRYPLVNRWRDKL